MKKIIEDHFFEHRATLDLVADLSDSIEKVAKLFINCLKNDDAVVGVYFESTLYTFSVTFDSLISSNF